MIVYLALLLLSTSHAVDIRFDIAYYAPFLSYGGYASEALAMVHAFHQWIDRSSVSALSVSGFSYNTSLSLYQHGDTPSRPLQASSFVEKDLAVLRKYMKHQNRLAPAPNRDDSLTIKVVICHSEPGAWSVPEPKYMTMNACPPSDTTHRLLHKKNSDGNKNILHKVGRTMFETDRIPNGWAGRLNYMDEIFIPSEFFRETFLRQSDDNGESEEREQLASKLTVVGEPVDTKFFSPSPASAMTAREIHPRLEEAVLSGQTIFLFVGKWETRKAIDVLVSAFVDAFLHTGDGEEEAEEEKPLLVLLTNAYYSSSDFDALVRKHLSRHLGGVIDGIMTNSILILTQLPQLLLPTLYTHITALVQPSRGEGWGRPLVEAMACGVPVITTNWSGQLAYANNENSYLLDSEGLVPAEGWRGHYWAQPSQAHLEQLLKHIHHQQKEAPGEVDAKGRRAREDMLAKYSYEQFSYTLQQRIEAIGERYYSPSHGHDAGDEL